MHRAGVKMLAATDALVWYVFPGFSLHDELELFVKAGLNPLEALQTATRNPAIYLGMIDMVGTVDEGKKMIWCYWKQTHWKTSVTQRGLVLSSWAAG